MFPAGLRYLFAGLQAGVSGALSLLLWMIVAARFFGKSVWWPPNLVASAFYGDLSLTYAFGRYTFAGFALVIFVYGLVGMAFASVWRARPAGLTLLFAALSFAVLLYYLLLKVVWRHFSPAGALYAPERQIFIGHLLFGLALSRFPGFTKQPDR